MELITISGFLGSGKTTLLLRLARAYVEQGRKVAIIENEVGENGVDGEELMAEGLDVREIYAGCVCCSLRHDLIHTLLELERDVQPDVVFLEPSGVAGPKQIQRCLLGYGGEIEKQTFVVVADAQRLPAIQDFSIPLIHDGLEIADLVVINKCDLVSAEQLNALEARVREVNATVDLLCISAKEGELNELIEAVQLHCPGKQSEIESLAPEEFPEATIFAASVTVEKPAADAASQIKEMLQSLSRELGAIDGILIGHLKAIMKTKPTGYRVFSVTAADEIPTEKGRLPTEPITELTLTMNAIVYGIDDEPFSKVCKKKFQCLEAAIREG